MKKNRMFDFIVMFLMPTLLGKMALIYFGMNYSQHPGEGYGIGLVISIIFTLCMFARFLWRYKDFQDQ